MNRFYIFVMAVLLSVNVLADNRQTVTVNGQPVDKTVKEITFNGDNVILLFSDNSTKIEDMSLVQLVFSYGPATGINQLETVKEALQGKVYNLNGQLVGDSIDGLAKGIYIVNGKKVIIK